MRYTAWQESLMDRAAYNGIRREDIERVAEELRRSPEPVIGQRDFTTACMRQGINAENFTMESFKRLQTMLNI